MLYRYELDTCKFRHSLDPKWVARKIKEGEEIQFIIIRYVNEGEVGIQFIIFSYVKEGEEI